MYIHRNAAQLSGIFLPKLTDTKPVCKLVGVQLSLSTTLHVFFFQFNFFCLPDVCVCAILQENKNKLNRCFIFYVLLYIQLINNTHMKELVLSELSTKIHWNTRLTASDVFHIKFNQLSSFNSIIVDMSEKRASSNRQ